MRTKQTNILYIQMGEKHIADQRNSMDISSNILLTEMLAFLNVRTVRYHMTMDI